jgi:hypothetical protein
MRRKNPLRNYYKILGIPFDASDDEVKSAYRRLAKQYHPDIVKNAEAAERMKLINEAYEVLKDKRKRAVYDYIYFRYKAWVQKEQYRYPELGTVQPVYRPGLLQRIVSGVVVTIMDVLFILVDMKLIPLIVPMISCMFSAFDREVALDCLLILVITLFLVIELYIHLESGELRR